MGKNRNRVTTGSTEPDADTAAYLDRYRRLAADRFAGAGMERGLGGIEEFYNPHEASVVAGVQSDYDRQRGLASRRAADLATKAGAFGGSRSAVLEAGLLGDINREEIGRLAEIRRGGFDTAADRLLGQRAFRDQSQRAALEQMLQGLQFGGKRFQQTERLPYNDFQDLIGLGIAGASLL